MNRSSLIVCAALLVLVLGPGACSKAADSNSDLMSNSYAQTGMLNPVVAVGERPDFALDEVVVTAPALRLEVEGTTVRLVVPGFVGIEVSVFRPSADSVNQQGKQMAGLRRAGDRRMPRYSRSPGTDGIGRGERR